MVREITDWSEDVLDDVDSIWDKGLASAEVKG